MRTTRRTVGGALAVAGTTGRGETARRAAIRTTLAFPTCVPGVGLTWQAGARHPAMTAMAAVTLLPDLACRLRDEASGATEHRPDRGKDDHPQRDYADDRPRVSGRERIVPFAIVTRPELTSSVHNDLQRPSGRASWRIHVSESRRRANAAKAGEFREPPEGAGWSLVMENATCRGSQPQEAGAIRPGGQCHLDMPARFHPSLIGSLRATPRPRGPAGRFHGFLARDVENPITDEKSCPPARIRRPRRWASRYRWMAETA